MAPVSGVCQGPYTDKTDWTFTNQHKRLTRTLSSATRNLECSVASFVSRFPADVEGIPINISAQAKQ